MTEGAKCPRCGSEMEEGYVKMMEGIKWRTYDDRGGELLRHGTPFGTHEHTAYLCRNCHWILIEYL